MSDLDEKLREITLSPFKDSGNMTAMHDDKEKQSPIDEQIAQIHQAFADDVKEKLISGGINGVGVYEVHESEDYNRMSGQEWYERFIKELDQYQLRNNYLDGPHPDKITALCIDAAKKASGISDQKDRT